MADLSALVTQHKMADLSALVTQHKMADLSALVTQHKMVNLSALVTNDWSQLLLLTATLALTQLASHSD